MPSLTTKFDIEAQGSDQSLAVTVFDTSRDGISHHYFSRGYLLLRVLFFPVAADRMSHGSQFHALSVHMSYGKDPLKINNSRWIISAVNFRYCAQFMEMWCAEFRITQAKQCNVYARRSVSDCYQ